MKKLKNLLLVLLVSLMSLTPFTSFSQMTHIFYVEDTHGTILSNEYTVSDTVVKVGDIIKFVNKYVLSEFYVKRGNQLSEYLGMKSMNDVIYTDTITEWDLQDQDLGQQPLDIKVSSTNNQFAFQYIHFTIIDSTSTLSTDNLNDLKFSVYPNPTSNVLNIKGDNIESVKVFDMNGQLVLSDVFSTTSISLNVSTLTNGYYTVLINDVKQRKFIKL